MYSDIIRRARLYLGILRYYREENKNEQPQQGQFNNGNNILNKQQHHYYVNYDYENKSKNKQQTILHDNVKKLQKKNELLSLNDSKITPQIKYNNSKSLLITKSQLIQIINILHEENRTFMQDKQVISYHYHNCQQQVNLINNRQKQQEDQPLLTSNISINELQCNIKIYQNQLNQSKKHNQEMKMKIQMLEEYLTQVTGRKVQREYLHKIRDQKNISREELLKKQNNINYKQKNDNKSFKLKNGYKQQQQTIIKNNDQNNKHSTNTVLKMNNIHQSLHEMNEKMNNKYYNNYSKVQSKPQQLLNQPHQNGQQVMIQLMKGFQNINHNDDSLLNSLFDQKKIHKISTSLSENKQHNDNKTSNPLIALQRLHKLKEQVKKNEEEEQQKEYRDCSSSIVQTSSFLQNYQAQLLNKDKYNEKQKHKSNQINQRESNTIQNKSHPYQIKQYFSQINILKQTLNNNRIKTIDNQQHLNQSQSSIESQQLQEQLKTLKTLNIHAKDLRIRIKQQDYQKKSTQVNPNNNNIKLAINIKQSSKHNNNHENIINSNNNHSRQSNIKRISLNQAPILNLTSSITILQENQQQQMQSLSLGIPNQPTQQLRNSISSLQQLQLQEEEIGI